MGCLLGGLVALLLVATGVAALFWLGVFSPKPTSVPTATSANLPTASKNGPRGAELRALTEPQLRKRLVDEGFTVLSSVPGEGKNGPRMTMAIRKAAKAGSVTISHFESEGTAILFEESLQKAEAHAVFRDGKTVVSVLVFGDPPLAKRTLDKILGIDP